MRQAITAKYLGATNYRGTRIKVKASAMSKIVDWDYSKGDEENYYTAAFEMATELKWLDKKTHLVGGSLPNNEGYCFVIATR